MELKRRNNKLDTCKKNSSQTRIQSGIIYVLALAHFKTGGLELLHQLVYELNQMGGKSVIVYYNLRRTDNINPYFFKYVNSYITESEIVDSERNILITPETRIQALSKYKKIKKIIWWLSVDNYYPTQSLNAHIQKFGLFRTCKHIIFYHDVYRDWDLRNVADVHLAQSEYAKQYLEERNIKNIFKLSDYLNDIYFEKKEEKKRESIVFYNPAKGFEFTNKIIRLAPDIHWVALQGMTTEEVRDCLLTGKLYIDFGNHPGKDRFPREAAMLGCCIITGKRGAAGNDVDIPISREFKFADMDKNIPRIIAKIRECLDYYDDKSVQFDEYREIIAKEKEGFQNDIKKIFGNVETRKG